MSTETITIEGDQPIGLYESPAQAAGEFVTDRLASIHEVNFGEEIEAELQKPLSERRAHFNALIEYGVSYRDEIVDIAFRASIRAGKTPNTAEKNTASLRRSPRLLSAVVSETRLKVRGQDIPPAYVNMAYAKLIDPQLVASYYQGRARTEVRDDEETKALESARALDETEAGIWGILDKNIQTTESWNLFSNWIAQKTIDRDGSVDPLLEMLAVDTVDRNSSNRLADIHHRVMERDRARYDGAALESLILDPKDIGAELTKWLALIMAGREGNTVETLLAHKSAWPDALQRAVQVRAEAEAQHQLECVKENVKTYFMSYQQEPDASNALAAYSKSFAEGRGRNNLVAPSKRKAQNRGRYTAPLHQINAAEIEQIPDNRVLAARTINHQLEFLDEGGVQKMIDGYLAGYRGNTDLKSDLADIIASLTKNPFSKGTTPFEEKRVRYEGRAVRVRRLNTTLQPELPLRTEIAKDTRVIYVTQRNDAGGTDIGVLAVMRRNDYERWRP